MFRYIIIFLAFLYFGIPFMFQQAYGMETKVIEMNGQEWLVIIEPGKEPMLKPLEKPRAKVTKLPFVIHGEEKEEVAIEPTVKKEPEWQRRTVKESKIVQTCDDPMGCEMTVEGDCPDCKTELVKEETVEVVQKSDFTEFKGRLKVGKALNEMEEKLPNHLLAYQFLRDSGSPDWICWKVQETCWAGEPITIEDLFAGKMSASYCKSRGHYHFDYTRPLESCQHSTILNL